MIKRVALFIMVMIISSVGVISYADEEYPVAEDPVEEYTSIESVTSNLIKSGSNAVCTITVKGKNGTDTVKGTIKLVNGLGTTVSTKSGTFSKVGPLFTYSHSFNMPSSGTYKVKYTIKTYKNGVKKETITGHTNIVRK